MLPPLPFPAMVTEIHGRSLPAGAIPVGYAALITAYGLRSPLPRTLSAIGIRHRKSISNGWRILTPRHTPRPTLEGHLTFALKYEGFDLALLDELFSLLDPASIESIVRAKPTGAYARRLWFLYEWLTGRVIDMPALRRGSYVDALDTRLQFPGVAVNSQRHRVRNNLPGTPTFCPLVFRTPKLARYDAIALSARAADIMFAVPSDQRAMVEFVLDDGEGLASYQQCSSSLPEPLRGDVEAFFENTQRTLDVVSAAACIGFGAAQALKVRNPSDPCHRQTIQDVLFRRRFSGVTVPVSMVSLKRHDEYRLLLSAGRGGLFDATPHAEFLHECIAEAVDKALPDAARAVSHFSVFLLETSARTLCSDRLSAFLFEQMRKHGGTLPRALLARRRCRLTPREIEEFETIFRKSGPVPSDQAVARTEGRRRS